MSESRLRKGGGRELVEIDLLEISATSKPMHAATRALSWKNVDVDPQLVRQERDRMLALLTAEDDLAALEAQAKQLGVGEMPARRSRSGSRRSRADDAPAPTARRLRGPRLWSRIPAADRALPLASRDAPHFAQRWRHSSSRAPADA